jgi:hypothetical protein
MILSLVLLALSLQAMRHLDMLYTAKLAEAKASVASVQFIVLNLLIRINY